MKLLLLCFLCLILSCPFCRAQTDVALPGAQLGRPANFQLKYLLKEHTLWNGSKGYCSANFSYNRAVSQVSEFGVCRASSYLIPLLYGVRINSDVSFEGGVFGGLNRHRQLGTSMFRSSETTSQSQAAYGLIVGLAHQINDGVDFKLRYRYDANTSFQVTQPIQAGLSFGF